MIIVTNQEITTEQWENLCGNLENWGFTRSGGFLEVFGLLALVIDSALADKTGRC
jgi:hypothetical protein